MAEDAGDDAEELGGLLAEAKLTLEATKFTSGTGTNEAFGLLTGITNNVNATTGQTVDAEDVYRLEQALPPRYQPRARYMASGTIVNTIYRLVGGGSTEPALVSEDRTRLLGKPLVINSAMGTTTATGVEFLVYGDFGSSSSTASGSRSSSSRTSWAPSGGRPVSVGCTPTGGTARRSLTPTPSGR